MTRRPHHDRLIERQERIERALSEAKQPEAAKLEGIGGGRG